MELFLQTLATKAVAVAQQRKAKTLTASHLCVRARATLAHARAARSRACRAAARRALLATRCWTF
jgi:hypothetical protein